MKNIIQLEFPKSTIESVERGIVNMKHLVTVFSAR